jgi:asparagine synthase (glutamine-hydrolysing)
MCGISGIFHYRTLAPVSQETVERMSNRLVHRGPDQSGFFFDSELGIAHRRLSIIDLSETGRQPMANEDGNVVVVYNGEIYNFAELRSELLASGHVFRSSSDTEVLVHLWEDRRTAMLQRLEGMFAFAIFDRRTRELFLARDRLGEKPLYWAPVPDGVVFASEIKALGEVPGVDLTVDTSRVAEYLSRQYVVAPRTVYRGVQALEPASTALFAVRREPTFSQYWTPRPRTDLPRSSAERRRLVANELERTIRGCTIADVPVGCFLSSGIDSSIVVNGMQKGMGGPVETFSIGFTENGYDESRESTILARRLGLKHHVEMLRPLAFTDLESILQCYDQPFGDSAAIPTYLLSRVAHARTKVVLTGDGGDEVFGGYERYRLMLLSGSLPCAAPLQRIGRALVRHGGTSMSPGRITGRALIVAASNRADAYASVMAPFDPSTVETLVPGVPRVSFEREAECFRSVRDVTMAAQVADLTTYLPSCLTTKVDIASMAHSLETRAPFLNHKLVEIGLALPVHERLRIIRTKVLLRRLARDSLGKDVARRRKRGFGVPLEVWLRGPMRDEASAYLLGDQSRLHRLLDRSSVEMEVRRFFAGDRSRYFRVWTLFALEAWLRGPLGRRAVA